MQELGSDAFCGFAALTRGLFLARPWALRFYGMRTLSLQTEGLQRLLHCKEDPCSSYVAWWFQVHLWAALRHLLGGTTEPGARGLGHESERPSGSLTGAESEESLHTANSCNFAC